MKQLKDKFIHDNLGIPIQTLMNWKRSEGYTSLIYHFLVHQDKTFFETKAKSIADLYEYELMKPEEFAILVKENWDTFDVFSEYTPEDLISSDSKENQEVILYALGKKDSKEILVLRFVSGVSKQKKLFQVEIDKTNKLFIKKGLEKPKIIYIANKATQPEYFGEYIQELSLISYAELFKKISDKKILIV